MPPLRADEAKIRQVLLNLLSNAIKFTPEGGRVTIEAASEPGGLAVRIVDTGIGMTADEVASAMEPFTQIDNTLARRHKGTGLGLPLTRRLIELHGGSMTIASDRGEGTRVTVVSSEERRVGKEGGRTVRSRGSPGH